MVNTLSYYYSTFVILSVYSTILKPAQNLNSIEVDSTTEDCTPLKKLRLEGNLGKNAIRRVSIASSLLEQWQQNLEQLKFFKPCQRIKHLIENRVQGRI